MIEGGKKDEGRRRNERRGKGEGRTRRETKARENRRWTLVKICRGKGRGRKGL